MTVRAANVSGQYTPGPYIIAPPGGPQGPFFGLVNQQGNVVATQIVGEANARLFQAAPEMYELIRELWQGWHTAPRGQFEDRIVALLNKAEGRTS